MERTGGAREEPWRGPGGGFGVSWEVLEGWWVPDAGFVEKVEVFDSQVGLHVGQEKCVF